MSEALSAPIAAPSAEPAGAVLPSESPSHSNPLGSQVPMPEKAPEQPKEPMSARDALLKSQQAIKDAKAKEAPIAKEATKAPEKPVAAPKVEAPKPAPVAAPAAEPVATPAPVAAERPQHAEHPDHVTSRHREAPSRFNDDAKAAWAAAPESLRAETHRAVTELTSGLEHYKSKYEPVREYDELATKHNVTLKSALDTYVGLDMKLNENFMSGLDELCTRYGRDLRTVAAEVMGQPPEQAQAESGKIVTELRNKVRELEQQIGGVHKTFADQKLEGMTKSVSEFAGKNEHFETVADTVASLLRSDIIAASDPGERLQEAYEKACRLHGLENKPLTPAIQAADPAPKPAPLIPAGQKSVSGAPATGSNPTATKRPLTNGQIPSARDAVAKAAARRT